MTQDTSNVTEFEFSPSTICSTTYTPRLITGMIIDHLRRHFSNPVLQTTNILRNNIWSADENTGILIEEITRWEPRNTQKRPAIIVKRNTVKNLPHLSIGDRAQLMGDFSHYCVLWQGSHTIFNIANSAAEVEYLASDVGKELSQFTTLWVEQLGLTRLRIEEIGEISKLEEAQEHFVVPVTIGYGYQETWRVKKDIVPINKIDLRFVMKN